MSRWDSENEEFFENESGGSDSEPEVPVLSVDTSTKKRSRSSSSYGQTRQSDPKRSRVSRIRGSVDEILATLNKDDITDEHTTNPIEKFSVENRTPVQTPHASRRSSSAPGSRASVKTPVRKVVIASSRSATTSRGACKNTAPSLDLDKTVDNTPSRMKTSLRTSEADDNFDLDDGDDDFSLTPSHSPTPLQSPTQPNVSVALKEITSLLNTVVKRMDRMENELKRHSTSVSSSSAGEGSKKSKKHSVPLVVKSEVRKTYNMLLEDEEDDFEGFDLDPSVPFNGPTNEAIVARLIKEVIANNPQFQACDVRAAVRTYYRTKAQEKSLKERGKYEERGRARRRRERLLRKLQERSSIFYKSDMSPKAKEKWNKVLQAEVMSSEESGPEENDMFVKPLPWRSDLVNNFFAELDEKGMERKTAQALRQRKKRIMSIHASTRSAPSGLPKWAIKA